MTEEPPEQKICVVKAGSAVLTKHPSGEIDLDVLRTLCNAILELRNKGWKSIIVTSGAVAAGKGVFQANPMISFPNSKPDSKKRMFAAMGQAALLSLYKTYLEQESSPLRSAQVLLTKDAFADKDRYHSLRSTLREMLASDVLPIINTNDVIHVPSLDFTDNDQLAAYVAAMIGADYLFLLTDTDGVYTKNPKNNPDAQLISKLPTEVSDWPKIEIDDSAISNGGMGSKLKAMRFMLDFGIACTITNGKRPKLILDIVAGNPQAIGTSIYPPARRSIPSSVRWMATGAKPQGTLIVSAFGAESIQRDDRHRGSILAIGVEAVLGQFPESAIVAIRDSDSILLGVGRVKFSAEQMRLNLWKAKDTVIVHRDNLMPMRQGATFVDEREHVKLYATMLAAEYSLFVRRKTGYISVWKNSDPNGFRHELSGPAAQTVLARSERMANELGIKINDWILYEMESQYSRLEATDGLSSN